MPWRGQSPGAKFPVQWDKFCRGGGGRNVIPSVAQGLGESQFAPVDTTVSGEYTAFGLPGGMHAYKIVGVNAVGAGPASDPVTIDVAQAQAA